MTIIECLFELLQRSALSLLKRVTCSVLFAADVLPGVALIRLHFCVICCTWELLSMGTNHTATQHLTHWHHLGLLNTFLYV